MVETKVQNSLIKQEDMLEAITFFMSKVNANYSGSSLYFGISYLLEGYIPQFFIDNLNSIKIAYFINKGFRIRDD